VVKIAVREAYFHCGKALMRSKLWSKDAQIERARLPSISQVVHAQTKLGTPETQAEVEERFKTQL
jgi:predicted pyridoxine 5'-phosphate oxidase superfamily flavin-nucleotide-binding protein